MPLVTALATTAPNWWEQGISPCRGYGVYLTCPTFRTAYEQPLDGSSAYHEKSCYSKTGTAASQSLLVRYVTNHQRQENATSLDSAVYLRRRLRYTEAWRERDRAHFQENNFSKT